MVASPRQLLAAGLHRGSERRVVLLLVAGAAQPPVGIRVGEVGQTVVAHALRELAHLLHSGRVGSLMFAAWGQVAAFLLRGSGKSGIPLSRMHCAYARPAAALSTGAALFRLFCPHAASTSSGTTSSAGTRRRACRFPVMRVLPVVHVSVMHQFTRRAVSAARGIP